MWILVSWWAGGGPGTAATKILRDDCIVLNVCATVKDVLGYLFKRNAVLVFL